MSEQQLLVTIYGVLLVAIVMIVRFEFVRARKGGRKSAYIDGWTLARNGWTMDKR